jgi:hypothetical protein
MKKDSAKPTRTLYLSLPDDTYELIKRRAFTEQMSVTAWVRRSLGGKPRRRYRVKKAGLGSKINAE